MDRQLIFFGSTIDMNRCFDAANSKESKSKNIYKTRITNIAKHSALYNLNKSCTIELVDI